MSRVAEHENPLFRPARGTAAPIARASARPGNRTSHAEQVGAPGAVIRHAPDGLEMVNLIWGFEPSEPNGRSLSSLRSEDRRWPTNRCLVPASEVFLREEGQRYRMSLVDGDWFYFAGIWRAATSSWPASYAILTVAAGPDVQPLRDRQNAVILREDRMRWLNGDGEAALLHPHPKGTFRIDRADADPRQGRLLF